MAKTIQPAPDAVQPYDEEDEVAPPPLTHNSPDEIATLTADEARARLTRDGVNLNSTVRRLLTERAASSDPPRTAPPLQATPFGGTHNPSLSAEEAAQGEPMLPCLFPKPVMLTIENNRHITFGMGRQEVPQRFVEPVMHEYLVANGVKRA